MYYRRTYGRYRPRTYRRRFATRRYSKFTRTGSYASFMRGLAAGRRTPAKRTSPVTVGRRRVTAPKLTLLSRMAEAQRAHEVLERKAAQKALVDEFIQFKREKVTAPAEEILEAEEQSVAD